MPRRRVPRKPATRLFDNARIVDKHDGQWHVRPVTGAASTKAYICPGCNRTIPMATPHVVVWPVEKALLSADPLDERRHWHTACWERKN